MKTKRLHIELIGREFYAPIADVVRMAYEMEPSQRVWGKPLHSEAMKLPGVVKHEGAWFAPAFDLADLVAGKPEFSNFELIAEQIIRGAEIARKKRGEQVTKEREEAKKFQQEAEEREREAREREETLKAIRKAQIELSKGLDDDENQEMITKERRHRMPKIEVLVTTEKANPKALVIPAIGTERIKLNYDFIEGVLVMGVSEVVRSAYDVQPGVRVWGNSLHQAIISLPGAAKTRKGWVAPARDLAGLVASRSDLPKAVETLRALIRVIELEKTEGSEVWEKAQKAKEEQLQDKEREERKARIMEMLDSVGIPRPQEESSES